MPDLYHDTTWRCPSCGYTCTSTFTRPPGLISVNDSKGEPIVRLGGCPVCVLRKLNDLIGVVPEMAPVAEKVA